jgi:glutamine---fructose-6-phosphate transaminase (isomerizing)
VTLRSEIGEQPAVAARLLDTGPPALAEMGGLVARRRPAFVVIAARGSSDHAAIYAQYLLGIRNRLAVALATPSALTLYGARPDLRDGLVIGISQSGQSEDIVAVVAEARRQGALTLAVTNDPASPLASAAAHVFELRAGAERAVAATKTYTAQLLAVALLSLAIDPPSDAEASDLARLAGWLEAALRAEEEAAARAHERRLMERCVVLGRGYDYATAREWALKLQELAQVLAVPYSAADFEHGPLALIEPGFDVLAVAAGERARTAMEPLLKRLAGELGARPLIVSDDRHLRAPGGIETPAGVAPWLGPIVHIVAGQLFAYHLTRARGLDPESPRTINKVTVTR